MHLHPAFIPKSLGDASDRISELVFGARGLSDFDLTGTNIVDQVFSPRARGFFSLAGGGLTGSYPNPDVVPDISSLVIAGQVFGPKIANR